MKKLLNALCAATALVSVNAGVVPHAAAGEIDWTGFYAGLVAGWGPATFNGAAAIYPDPCDTSTTICPPPPSSTGGGSFALVADQGDFSLTDESFLAGTRIGANTQYGSVILGFAGDFLLADFGVDFDFDRYPATLALNVDRIATARGLIGLPLANIMPYVTAGVAAARFNGTLSVYDGLHTGTYVDTTNLLGLTAGAGVIVAATSNVWFDFGYQRLSLGTGHLEFFDGSFLLGTADVAVSGDIFTVGMLIKMP